MTTYYALKTGTDTPKKIDEDTDVNILRERLRSKGITDGYYISTVYTHGLSKYIEVPLVIIGVILVGLVMAVVVPLGMLIGHYPMPVNDEDEI